MRPQATSGLPVTLMSLTPEVCVGSGIGAATLLLVDVGICRFESWQDGDDVWARAPVLQSSVNVVPSAQQVEAFVVPDTPLSRGSIVIKARTTSGMPVIWSSSSPSTRLTRGSFGRRVQLKASGTCTLTAEQPGNRFWRAAAATTSFQIREDVVPPRPTLDIKCKGATERKRRSLQCSGQTVDVPTGARIAAYVRDTSAGEWRPVAESRAPTVRSDGSVSWRFRLVAGRSLDVRFAYGDTVTDVITVTFSSQ